MTRWTVVSAALGFVIAIAACGRARGTEGVSGAPGPVQPVVITVQNENWLDVDVYRVRSGARFRLGTVSAYDVEAFKVPAGLVNTGSLRILVDPIGSENVYTTGPILITPDQRLELTVTEPLSMSNYTVWNRVPRS